MSKQKRITEIAGEELPFLSSEWDSALLGFVERGGAESRHLSACYGYQAMKAVLLKEKNLTPEQVYAHIRKVINSIKGVNVPLLLTRLKRIPLWDAIRRENYPTWEYMNKAILGLGYIGWDCTGVVYNKPLCISILQSKQSTNNDSDMKDYALASTIIEETVIPLNLGEHTPWFLTPVK